MPPYISLIHNFYSKFQRIIWKILYFKEFHKALNIFIITHLF